MSPVVQFEPVDDQGVGVAELEHEAGADLQIVGILGSAGQDLDIHLVAAHRSGERLQIGDGGHHLECAGGRGGPPGERETAEQGDETQCDLESSHGEPSLRTDAPDGRP